MKRHAFIGAPVVALLLSACSLAPIYERPVAPVPAAWPGTPQPGTVPAAGLAWQAFVADDTLRALVEQALAQNRELRQTLLNVEAVRAQHGIQRSERGPRLQLEAGQERERRAGEPAVQSSAQIGLRLMSFELDLFGRVQSLSEAAWLEYLATGEAAEGSRISLVAEVIDTYLRLQGARRRHALATQMLQARRTALQLTAELRARGFAEPLDYQEAAGLVREAEVALEQVDRERRQATNALGLLAGSAPADGGPAQRPEGDALLVRDLAPGASSDLLLRRPDVRAAESRLKSRHASIGAARAAFFPRITLTGMLGRSSSDLSDLFSAGGRAWSFAPQLSLPIFDGGANQANLDLAHVRRDIAVAAYEQAIQVAFREVGDALAAVDTLEREAAAQRSAASISAEVRRLSEIRYRSGAEGHLRFMEAQRSEFTAQMALIEVQTQRQLALSALFRSLGGEWQHAPVL